jgi:hypothetical protein
MVFEYLLDDFNPKDSTRGFIQLHQPSSHVAMGCFLGSIICVFGVVRLFVLANLSSGIKLIAMGEVLHQSVNKALCFQLQDAFSSHLSPHQFNVVILLTR